MLDFGADVAAGVYPTKTLDRKRLAAAVGDGRDEAASAGLRYGVELERSAAASERDGFVRARYAGTGFLMIRWRALVALTERYPELKYARVHANPDPLAGSANRLALSTASLSRRRGPTSARILAFASAGPTWVGRSGSISKAG